MTEGPDILACSDTPAWEYRVLTGPEAKEEEFNSLGREGWELTTGVTNQAGLCTYVFRRTVICAEEPSIFP